MLSILRKVSILLSPISAFIGHEYFQHIGAEFLGHGRLEYRVFLFHDYMPVHNSIKYDYTCNLQITGSGEEIRAHENALAAPNEEAALTVPIVKK